jgi:hypothetical protein
MPANKTKPTGKSVEAHLAARASDDQLEDCMRLITMFRRLTRKQPHMWGPTIVGFGSYTYTYPSGHSGQAPVVGFAVRGRDLVIYLMAEGAKQKALLAKVGKYRMGKSCFYFKRLDDLDTKVLEQLVAGSIAGIRERYG